MPASKPDTPRFSLDAFGETDFAKVDAHVITPEEYEEIPELTDEWFAEADFHVGDKLIRKGRPRSPAPKKLVSLRLDQAVLDGLRATGPGWQGRANDVLKRWLERGATSAVGS